jgi:hypothetical protein
MIRPDIKIKAVRSTDTVIKDIDLAAKIKNELLKKSTSENTLKDKLFNSGDFDASTFFKG